MTKPKRKRGRPKKLTADQLEMARRYESVWQPHGLSAKELAKKVARVAESDDALDKLDNDDSLD